MKSKKLEKKLVVVLNDKIETGRAMNAIAHMALGLSSQIINKNDLRLQDYISKDNEKYPSISDMPFIVLKTNKTKLRKFRDEVKLKDICHTSFIDTMIGENYISQHKNTNEKTIDEIEFFGVCCFGNVDELNEMTKKFSLYK